MHTSFGSIDIIDEAVFAVAVSIVVLESYFHIDVVLGSLKVEDLRIQRCFAAVQIRDKFLDAAFKVEYVLSGLFGFFSLFGGFHAHIPQRDLEAFGQKSHLSHSLLENIIIKYSSFLKHDRIRHKGNY